MRSVSTFAWVRPQCRAARSGRLGLAAVAALAALTIVSAGCGGGGGSPQPASTPTPTPTPTPTATPVAHRVAPAITILWPARSRATNAPASALSAVVAIKGASDSGGDVAFTIDRDVSKVGGYIQTYTSPTAIREGAYTVTIAFFAQADGGGSVVSQATIPATIGDSATLPDITLNDTITRVEVAGGQSVLAGQTADLTVTAFAGQAVVAITPGSIFLSVASGSANLAALGSGATIQGLHPGTATVVATIDGIASLPAAVAVTSNTVVSIVPAVPAVAYVNGTVAFRANVTGAPDMSVVWSVQEGAAGGTIDQGGVYTAPAANGTYHVVATSVYDPTHAAVVPVVVADGSITVGVSFPTSGGVTVGGEFPGSGSVGATVN